MQAKTRIKELSNALKMVVDSVFIGNPYKITYWLDLFEFDDLTEVLKNRSVENASAEDKALIVEMEKTLQFVWDKFDHIEFKKERELYRPVKAHRKICNCPFCGSDGQLWEYEPEPDNFQKVVMCSDEECPMYMPPEGFYFVSKNDAISAWNTRATQ